MKEWYKQEKSFYILLSFCSTHLQIVKLRLTLIYRNLCFSFTLQKELSRNAAVIKKKKSEY